MKSKTRTYKCYGLLLKSEISLMPLIPVENSDDYDIYIERGKVTRPRDGIDHTYYKPNTVYNNSIFYWKVDKVASFIINGNDHLIVEKIKGSLWQDVRAFLMDTVLTVLMIKNEKFLFHASCVSYKGHGYLFYCSGGEGKSTIAASLSIMKCRFIEDDRCLLEWSESKDSFVIRNHIPVASLWANIKVFEKIEKVKNRGTIRKHIQKYYYDVSGLVPKRAVPVKKIFLIEQDNGKDRIVQNDVKGKIKVNILLRHTHLAHLIPGLGKGTPHFSTIAKLSSKVPLVHILRSRLTPIPKLVKHIQDEISS